MPLYDFVAPDGRTVERFFHVNHVPQSIRLQDGRRARLAAFHGSIGIPAKCWPMICESLGMHPDQVSVAKRNFADKGVQVDFTADGDPIIESRSQARKICKIYGLRFNG